MKWCEVMWSELKWCEVMRSELQWCKVMCSEVMILGEMCVSTIYVYVSVCMYCAVRCLIIICFYVILPNCSTNILMPFFLVFCFVYSVCIVSPCLYNWPFPIFVLYQPTDHCHRLETQLQYINIISKTTDDAYIAVTNGLLKRQCFIGNWRQKDYGQQSVYCAVRTRSLNKAVRA
jgi:hypothetical protein